MMRSVIGGLLACAVLAIAASAGAQSAPPSDADAAYAVVEAFFDGMRAKDTDALAATLAEDARLVSASTSPDGVPQFRVTPMSQFLESIGNATVSLDEPIWDPVIQVSDRLATIWVKYALYVGGDFSHCGVDAFQLFKAEAGWKIFQIADTRRRADCWEPPA